MSKLITFISQYLCGLACAVYLFTLGVFSGRNRGLIAKVCRHFGFFRAAEVAPQADARALELPQVSIGDFCDEREPIHVLEPIGRGGNVALEEIVAIARVMQAHKPQTVFEIGTFDGRTTLNIAANLADGGRVLTLDLPRDQVTSAAFDISDADAAFVEKDVSGARFLGTRYAPRIQQLFGDSATFDFSPYEGQVDMVFVDGAHTYEYVMSDTERALRLLRNGCGVILWHDYNERTGQDVPAALHELRDRRPEFSDIRHIYGTSLVFKVFQAAGPPDAGAGS